MSPNTTGIGQFFNAIYEFLVAFNQARAAAYLARIGQHEQAQDMMKDRP
jgi:hypothetical protein